MSNNWIRKALFFAVIVLFIGAGLVPSISSDSSDEPISRGTIYVDLDAVPSWYDATHVKTIQEGVNNATEGDTVYVYNGTYYENVVVDKTINLTGENRNSAIIDGNYLGDNVIQVSADMVNISEFTIINSSGLFHGIEINSDGCTITDNILYNNCEGIMLFNSFNNSIINNTFISSYYGAGILLWHSNNNNVMENNFSKDGLVVLDSYHNNVSNNTVNGKPLVYLEGASNITVDNAGQVVIVSCDNITIQGHNLSHTSVGINMLDTSNCLISGNNISSNTCYGMHLDGCIGNIISGNNISSNAFDGMELYYSNNNYILKNTIMKNGWNGIYFHFSGSNNILRNTISKNAGSIFLGASCHNNKVYHNNVINSGQAYSDNNNFWDNGYPSGGNYFDDYSGVDNYHGVNQDIPGSDGIGDTPYHISGGSNEDNYPLMNPSGWPNIPPIADANGPYTGTTDDSVHFDGSGSYDPDGTIVSYEWDYGDGHIGTGVKPSHKYSSSGTYDITLTVTDDDGLTDTNGTTTVIGHGNPPLIQLIYPTGGEILKDTATIRWYAIDSEDSSNLPIHLFYSDDDGDTWFRINGILENTGEYEWDTTNLPDGIYELLIEAVDSDNNIGHDSSEPFQIKNHDDPPENEPPEKPSKPSGPTSGKAGTSYSYSSSTTDPDGDQVWYKWDWGDETSGWDGPYDSGDAVDASHIWDEKGDYSIKVKAKDVHGEESPWSDPLPITMPKNKAINLFIPFLEKLMERFPMLEQILQPVYDKLIGF